jgi:hypothetical protein
MKLAINIFKTKADLKKAIIGAESFCIDFRDNHDYFIQFRNGLPIQMERTDEDGDTLTKYTTLASFITAVWKRAKDFDALRTLWINNTIQDLDKMEKDAIINEAKGHLNTTQIKDQTLGLTSVMNPLEAKLQLEGNQNMIDMADAFSNMITDMRAAEGFGVSKHSKGSLKRHMTKMRAAMKSMEAELNTLPSHKAWRVAHGLPANN